MEQKTYVFAGASSYIAKAAAVLLTAQGHRVIGLTTKDTLSGYTEAYTVTDYNPGSYPAIEGAIHGLAYFPGSINLKPFNRLSTADFTTDFAVSALGAAGFVQAYLPNLKAAGNASVVFISTVAVGTGMPFHASVAMAKGALEGLTRSLAAELAPHVRVNCVAPSLTETPLAAKLLGSPEKKTAAQLRNPLKKVGTPEEVAQPIAFLLQDNSAWITGQILNTDGGMGSLRLL